MSGKRHSRQRELIYQALKHTDSHPTAEMLYQWLKPENPGLSLGTVYRNLHLLTEEGRIRQLDFPVERYDAETEPHPHFRCMKCSGVYNLPLPYDDGLDEKAVRASGCDVLGHDIVFYGVCQKCRSLS